jgi:hypothetical protein
LVALNQENRGFATVETVSLLNEPAEAISPLGLPVSLGLLRPRRGTIRRTKIEALDQEMSQPPRRWFQVSLKTLFVVVLAVAAFFGGVTTERRRAEKAAREAQEAAEAAWYEAVSRAEIMAEEGMRAAALQREAERRRSTKSPRDGP